MRFDAHRRAGRSFKEGDQVLVRTKVVSNDGKGKKLLPKYTGPYVVTKVLDHDRYVVEDPKGSLRSKRKYSGVISLDKLKAYNVEVSSDSEVEYELQENDD